MTLGILKMMRTRYVILGVFAVNSALLAQELRLFEETENTRSDSDDSVRVETRRDSDGNLISGPEFTLIGTSRIGGNNIVVIEDRYGEIISLSIPDGSSAPIPGYLSYRVLKIGGGEALIEYPTNIPCVEFVDQGVSCESQNIAALSLRNGSPLASANQSVEIGGVQGTLKNEEETLVNPFEALLERASNPEASVDQESSFVPRRINPEDVPPGMRVVSTPFGDRLVEIDQ
tara:strand:- start:92 stop:784 length:693 start_codon:yes stop_codon:yes gene_type:complete